MAQSIAVIVCDGRMVDQIVPANAIDPIHVKWLKSFFQRVRVKYFNSWELAEAYAAKVEAR